MQPLLSTLLIICLHFLLILVAENSSVPLKIDPVNGQLNAVEGRDFTIALTVQGNVSSVIWTFSCRGFVITNSSKFLILQNLPSISLTISSITGDDAETYSVTIANETAEVSAMFLVMVQEIPTFLEQPVAVASLVLEVVQLSCRVRGNPIPTITWFRDDAEVVSDGTTISIVHLEGETVSSSVLVIEELTINTAGAYHCNASNSLVTNFTIKSEEAVVTAQYAPNVTVSPTPSLTVNVTDTAILTCLVFAVPLPNITWIKEEEMSTIEGDEEGLFINETDSGNFRTSVLYFTNVSKFDQSYYTCMASNGIQNVLNTPTDGSIALVVQVPPTVIPLTSSPLYVVQGEIVTLSFNITNADPQVQLSNRVWTLSSRIGDEVVTESSHFQFSQDNQVLTINHVQVSAHDGTFTLTARNEAGTDSASIVVVVETAPTIFRVPSDNTVVEGDSASFECLVLGNPMPEQEWLHDGLTISFDSRISLNVEGRGTLFIKNVEFQDRGLYTCIYNNSLGDIERSAQLNVQVRGEFTDITVPENGTAGGSVTMTCNSTGVPAPSIKWLKDNVQVSESMGENVISSITSELSSGIMSVTSSLQLLGLVLNDTGSYSCRADNDLARPQTEFSEEQNLTVLYPPSVSINRVALTVNQTDQSSFTCEAFGIPVPSFEWFFNGSIDPLSRGSQIMNVIMTNSSGLDIQVSTLTIQDSIRSLHEGRYTCIASNRIKNSIGTPESAEAFLTVQVPPLVLVETEEPLGVVNRSVTISFTIEEASPVVSLQNIQWRFNDSISLNNGTQSVQLGHVFSSDLLSLTINNVQHIDQGFYSLTATNEAGTNFSEVFLEVEAAPLITVPPEDALQLEGNDAIFECLAVSEPQHTIQWQFNGSFINTSSEKFYIDELIDELVVFNVTLNDTGEYTCFVENIHGNDSASAVLTVQAVPQFRVNPIARSIQLIGESIELNCSSFAVPPANITWLKDGRLLDVSDSSVEVSSSIEDSITLSQLSLNNLGFADTGLYSCKATNDLVSEQSTNSTDAEIIVNMPVILLDSPSDSVVNETDAVEFSCVAEGLPAPLFTWSTPQQANLSLEDFVQISNTVNPSAGATRVESVLRFPSIEDSSANNYTCTANNTPREREESVSASFNIIVQTRPEVMFTGNGTVIGVQFRDTQMTFTVTRDLPKITQVGIRWFFTQQGVNTRREIVPGDQPDHYVFSNDRLTLSIMSLNLSDSGTYTVEASNIVGTGSALANLNVQRTPVIIIPLVSLTQLSGTNATFTCEAEADPQHTIEWTKEGEELFNSSKYLITGLGTARSTLKIINLELSDTGNYSCFAENLHGNDSTSDQLFVQVPPSFTEFPIASNLTAGGSVTIICNATGFPQPKVELLINGHQDASLTYETSTGSFTDGILYQSVSLFLSDLTFANTAEYSCRASNELASVENRTSPSADFTVQYAPNVSVTPSTIVVNESDAIVLTCEVFAIPIPNIVWSNSSSPQDDLVAPTDLGNIVISFDRSPHPSRFPFTVSNLSISSVLKVHEANYSCLASNGIENLLGTPENGSVSVVVQVPPTVIAEKRSVLGVVGRSVTLTFRIERASPEVELSNIRWTFTSSQSNSAQDITMSSNSRLSFSEDLLLLNVSDIVDNVEGTYTLTASNPAGVSNDSVILSVEAAPVFIEVPTDASALSGQPVIFQCNASSDPLYSIRWERDDSPIAEFLSPYDRNDSVFRFARINSSIIGVPVVIDSDKYRLEGEGPFFGQLTVMNVVLDDARTYTCHVSNVHGSLSASATLLVQVVPKFTSEFRDEVNTSVSENVTFDCNADGQPEPNITWYRNGVELSADREDVLIVEVPGERHYNSSLTLLSVNRTHEGEYWCNATNFLFERFEATSPRWIVNVYYPPNVVRGPESQLRNFAQYAVFICRVTAFPAPIVQWTRTGTNDPITDLRGKFEISNTLEDSSDIGPFSVETVLTILNLTSTDEQRYTCTGSSQVKVNNFISAVNNVSADLSVNVPPAVSALLDSPSIARWNKVFRIEFSIMSSQPIVMPENITWTFTPFTSSVGEIITSTNRRMISEDGRSLTINPVSIKDAGRYSLTAANIGGSSSASVSVNVLVEPEIQNFGISTQEPVPTGHAITLTCRADGIPTPRLRWLRNGTVVFTTGRTIQSTSIGPGLRLQVPTTESVVSNLTVNGIKDSDDYTQWTCLVENSVGSNQESYILRVEPTIDPCSPNSCQNNGVCVSNPFECICTDSYTGTRCEEMVNPDTIVGPTILNAPRPISAALGMFVSLTCTAEGNPQPRIEWYKDDVIISEARTSQYMFELGLSARGWYHCRAVGSGRGGSPQRTSSKAVLVTINNVVQYLMTARALIYELKEKFGRNLTNAQLTSSYIQEIDSEISGVSLSSGSEIISITLYQVSNESISNNLTFSAVVTVLTGTPSREELLDFLVGFVANPTFVLTELKRFDGCSSEVTSFSSRVYWPETNLGTTVELVCPCGDLPQGDGHPRAKRTCGGNFSMGAIWNSPDDSVCDFDIRTHRICNVSTLPMASDILAQFVTLSSNPASEIELILATSLIESLFKNVTQNASLLNEFFQIIDNIVMVDQSILQMAQETGNVSSRILVILDRVGEMIPVSSNLIFNQSSFLFSIKDSNNGVLQTKFTSGDLFVNLNIFSNGTSKYILTVFPDDRLFESDSNLASIVVGVSGNGQSDNQSARITFAVNQTLLTSQSELSCVFWDFQLREGRGDWSSDGCQRIQASSDGTTVQCYCDHFTHFTIIVNTPSTMNPEDSSNTSLLTGVEAVTVIIIIVSLVFLAVTILLYLKAWSALDTASTKLFLNTCVALILLYLIYIGAIYARESEVPCIIFSSFFHYAFLVAVFSILLECIFFFLRKLWKQIECYSPAIALTSWLIPALIVIFCVAPAYSLYSTDHLCRPRGTPFYLGVVVPFTISTIVSWVLLALGLLKARDEILHWVQLMSTSGLFTLGWVFALAVGEVVIVTAAVMELIFAITGGMLGLYMFLLYCIAFSPVRSTLCSRNAKFSSSSANVTPSTTLQRIVKERRESEMQDFFFNNNGSDNPESPRSPTTESVKFDKEDEEKSEENVETKI